jgi:hypothetical protein
VTVDGFTDQEIRALRALRYRVQRGLVDDGMLTDRERQALCALRFRIRMGLPPPAPRPEPRS